MTLEKLAVKAEAERERARRIEEQVEHHNPTGCTHDKKWNEYCAQCEVVWLRELYQSAMRRAEYARQRLLAIQQTEKPE